MTAPAFSVARCLAAARNALRKPPQNGAVRPEFAGRLVCEFVLPLGLCKTTNGTRHAKPWMQGKTKAEIQAMMVSQFTQQTGRAHADKCLLGRPQVLAVRFSRGEPDKYSDWAKAAIDVLTKRTEKRTQRLNVIVDDNPRDADVHQWREPMPSGECGFVYLQVRTGV